jgi:hypothetical protein
VPRRVVSLLLLALAGACASSAPPPRDAAPAPPDAASPLPDATLDPDLPPPDPILDTLTVRPAGDRTLLHMDCTINAAGAGMVAWRETDGEGKHQVWVSRLAHDTGWQPPLSLGPRATSELDRVSVTMDAKGRALLVWNEADGAAAGVVSARFDPATGWAPPARIGPGWVLTLAGDPGGSAAAFGVFEGLPPTLLRYTPAAGWTGDVTLALPRAGFFFASPLGRGALLWNQHGAAGDELYASDYAAGVWSAPLRLQEALPFDHPLPSVNATLAGDGSGLVAWNRGGELEGELWASATSAPGGWETPHRLSTGSAPLWTTTVLVKGQDGLVQWEAGMPPRREVWVALRAGGQWQDGTRLGEGSEFVTAALGGSGNAVVAWSTSRRVYARHHTLARGWGPTRAAIGDNGGLTRLCGGLDGAGRGWLLWISGSPMTLRAAAIEP